MSVRIDVADAGDAESEEVLSRVALELPQERLRAKVAVAREQEGGRDEESGESAWIHHGGGLLRAGRGFPIGGARRITKSQQPRVRADVNELKKLDGSARSCPTAIAVHHSFSSARSG
jgi:hypothetical protein